MIRIILLILVIALLGGGAFLYFWDIPADQQQVVVPLDDRVLRD